MRWSILGIFCVSIIAYAAFPQGIEGDLERFQGAWAAVSMQAEDGRPAPADEVAAMRLVVNRNKFTLTGKDYKISGTFSIDPRMMPKTIDVELDDESGDKLLGIYEIRGDVRRSCFAMPGRPRPMTFMYGVQDYLIFEWKPAVAASTLGGR